MNEYNLIILTGLSGSGKSTALSALEDLDYACVENLPFSLIAPFIKEVIEKYKAIDARGCNGSHSEKEVLKYALLVDSRLDSSFTTVKSISELLEGNGILDSSIRVGSIFIDCTDEVIIRRFRETRRKHPLLKKGSPYTSISDAVKKERELLKDFRISATRIIDTSQSSVHDLRRNIEDFCNEKKSLLVTFQSFGFKYGNPTDVDLLFDVRFLPNPYFDEELKEQTGLSIPVREFVSRDPDTIDFMKHLESILEFLIPRFEKEGKQYLNIGIGCTGGKHRSVVIAEEISNRLRLKNIEVQISHRDIKRSIIK